MTLYYNNFINKIPNIPNIPIPNTPYPSNIPYTSNIPNTSYPSNIPYTSNINTEELEKQLPFSKMLNTREYRKEFSNIKEYTSSDLLLIEIKTYLLYILILLCIIAFKLINN